MSTPSATIAESKSPRRRGWGQFSLVSLLLLVVIGCLVGAYLGEQRQRKAAEMRLLEKDLLILENEALLREYRNDLWLPRDDQSYLLKTADPKLVHVRRLQSADEATWRWRIHTPLGTKSRICVSQGEFWDSAKGSYESDPIKTVFPAGGEVTVEARLMRKLNGESLLQLRVGNSSGNRTIHVQFSDAGLKVLATKGTRIHQAAGWPKPESFPPVGRVNLLRWHVELDGKSEPGTNTESPGQHDSPRAYGLSLHLE